MRLSSIHTSTGRNYGTAEVSNARGRYKVDRFGRKYNMWLICVITDCLTNLFSKWVHILYCYFSLKNVYMRYRMKYISNGGDGVGVGFWVDVGMDVAGVPDG